MGYMFVRYSSRSSGSAAAWIATVILSVAGSIASASTTGDSSAAQAETAAASPQSSVLNAGDQNPPTGNNSTAAQCNEGEWQGRPLIARYKVSNYSIAKRTIPSPGSSIRQKQGDAVSGERGPDTALHQTEWMNGLLFDPSSQSTLSTSEFVLWREGDIRERVAHEHPKLAITEVWNRPGDRLLRRSRHFDAHNRAIEFEPFNASRVMNTQSQTRSSNAGNARGATQQSAVDQSVQSEPDLWIQKYHLAFQLPDVSAPVVHPDGYTELLRQGVAAGGDQQLIDVLSGRLNCNELKVLHEQQERYSSETIWDEYLRLPVYMQTVRDNSAPLDFTQSASERGSVGASSVISRWVLVSLESDENRVSEQFATWDSHETTDFADIGDNESDPFLMRMINLGFISHGASGFYDASGNLISGGAGHFHPPAR